MTQGAAKLSQFKVESPKKPIKNVAKHMMNIKINKIDSNFSVPQTLTTGLFFSSFSHMAIAWMYSISFENPDNF